MEELFDDQRNHQSGDQWLTNSAIRKTTIEEVDVSPIGRHKHMDSTEDMSSQSVYDLDSDLTFDRSVSMRKYSQPHKWSPIDFSPQMRSTPKPSKSTPSRRTQRIRKKSRKHCVNLWDKAIHKNPELKQWINSFNEDMKKIESSELSVIDSSILTAD